MSSIAVAIADSLASAITSAGFTTGSGQVVATRRYVPDYQLSELKSVRVSVFPGSIETERVSRAADLFSHDTIIGIAKLTNGENADADEVMELAEDILDAVRTKTLVYQSMPDEVQFFSASVQSSFDPDSLNDRRVFLAQIVVTFRVAR